MSAEIEKKIEEFNQKPSWAKNIIFAQAENFRAIRKTYDDVLKDCYKEGRGLYVESIVGDIAILRSHSDVKYFGFCLKTETGWRQNSEIANSLDEILLCAIGYKYGESSFAYFASKILGTNVKTITMNLETCEDEPRSCIGDRSSL